MIDDLDPPVDLAPLKAEMERRAPGVTNRVLARVGAARKLEQNRNEVREGVQRWLARFAVPGALAAALSFLAILATRGNDTPERPGEVFAVMVMGQTPAAKWVALGQPPEIAELLRAMEGR
jgi:hypothetical protein